MFLSRITKALRAQNWFAVLVELVIVVVGVAIGFQITTWGNASADRETEQSYLVQLVSDLKTTAEMGAIVETGLAASDRAASRLFESFRMADPPSADSLLWLSSTATTMSEVTPILGTFEALVSTGDLALIRNDTLRMFIPTYLESQKQLVAMSAMIRNRSFDSMAEFARYVDIAEADEALVSGGGSVGYPRPAVSTASSPSQRPSTFPFDASEFLGNPDAYRAVYRMHHLKIQARLLRNRLVRSATSFGKLMESKMTK